MSRAEQIQARIYFAQRAREGRQGIMPRRKIKCQACDGAGWKLVPRRKVVKGVSFTEDVVEDCKECTGRGWL